MYINLYYYKKPNAHDHKNHTLHEFVLCFCRLKLCLEILKDSNQLHLLTPLNRIFRMCSQDGIHNLPSETLLHLLYIFILCLENTFCTSSSKKVGNKGHIYSF